ncbi:hypothetical protein EX30DRAFT_344760 [Ascodesmis nigricans]|uniref:BTB domain-containing protein n=1 Tax=Ascodesmis nigricans TaxID=341454 RepID=A0A4S2MII0_9PEZI|nr:hypothetical protein EX30DRAFT_344760 [Ascodesmis nigricans]
MSDRLAQKLARLLLSPTTSDITIVTGTTKFPAHLTILSLHTPYFQQNLTSVSPACDVVPYSDNETPESSACGDSEVWDDDKSGDGESGGLRVDGKPVVALHEFSSEAVEKMLEWCYTGDYEVEDRGNNDRGAIIAINTSNNTNINISDGNATGNNGLTIHVGVFYLAQRLKIPELAQLAVEFVQYSVTSDPAEFESLVKMVKWFGAAEGLDDAMAATVARRIGEEMWMLGGRWRDEWGLFEKYGQIARRVMEQAMSFKVGLEVILQRDMEERQRNWWKELEKVDRKYKATLESELKMREMQVREEMETKHKMEMSKVNKDWEAKLESELKSEKNLKDKMEEKEKKRIVQRMKRMDV